ncbi:hypothetical protein ANOM_002163 [Aspergillus nomiae NRRL 13137]|uniref:Uncharacterized protein n=1 Tax=Aspergillus nomiae NRRL (strain ATCC 15546 / NRRL 13137 / CBS 260.88 / M93) TaxID=1509407 RepID=A0A0L1JBY9_ASPN3|nr:uncharacterized protein ANOM_002163 [Aspergillus nomiae NRRL 13137]KNG89247.1 hypothetical protein ANOM_002163 [Aspergillus nomiae NRRL 13137]
MAIGESDRPFDSSSAWRESIDSDSPGKEKQRAGEPSGPRGGSGVGARSRDPRYNKPRGFWTRILKHFKRYWLCYGLLGIIFLAIFLPVFFLVIIPAIAQRLVNDASIPIHSAAIMQPTPDSLMFSLSASLNVPLGLSVRIDPLNLSLFNRDVKPRKPYVTAPLNGLRLKGKSDITITNQTTKILDEEQFTKFLSNAVYSKRFILSAYGKTTAHLGKIKVSLTLDKDIELNGLDMLNGFSIDAARLALPPEDDGSNLVGKATLPNYSVVTFALGNVTLNLKVDDLILGNGTINNVLLKPGNNSVPLRGVVDIPNAIRNIGPILAAETEALSQGNVMISASGNSTIYDGEHISYYEKVLNNLTISANVPILKVLFGSISGLVSSNPDVMQNVTDALRQANLSSSQDM